MPCHHPQRNQHKKRSGIFAHLTGMAMIMAIAALPMQALAQDQSQDTSLEVLTINGQRYTLNLVGSIINQLPDNVRNQPIDVYYNSVIDDIVDTKLTANAAIDSGLAENPLLKEIAERGGYRKPHRNPRPSYFARQQRGCHRGGQAAG